MLAACWNVMLNLAPWLLLGALIAAVMHVVFPKNFIRRQLCGWSGIVKAVLIGVPMPLCSCGVIPAGMGLKKDGASDGACVGFLISTPQTGVDSILVSASFLGWPFALFKVVSAALTGVLGGMLTHTFQDDLFTEEKEDETPTKLEDGQKIKAGFDHGVLLIQSIWGWLVFGIVVSAALEVLVPKSTLAYFSTLGALESTLAVLVISVPLYVCATSSVPIAAALVAGGMPSGMALVFLMAGPATNLATIGVIYRGFGLRVLSIYLAVIVVGSSVLGWTFDSIWVGANASVLEHEHQAWWATASAVLLLALFGWFLVQDVLAWIKKRAIGRVSAAQKREFKVSGMTCGNCVKKLETILSDLPNVESAVVTLDPGNAVVVGNIEGERIEKAIRGAGFFVG